jgi:hypothetical protein
MGNADDGSVGRSASERALTWGLGGAFALSVLAQTACALGSANLYLQDLPEWVYQSVLTARYLAGDPAVAAAYRLAPYPIPNSLFQLLHAALAVPLGPTGATKAILVLYTAGFLGLAGWATARFGAEERVERTILAAKLVFFGASFWLGNLNFQLGLLLLATYAVLEQREGRGRAGWTLLFGGVIFFAHAIVFGLFGLYVLVRAWQRREWAPLLATVPAGLLMLWYMYGRAHDPSGFAKGRMGLMLTANAGPVHYLLAKGSHFVKAGPFVNLRLADNGAFLPVALYVGGVLLSIACLVALGAGFLARWRQQSGWRYAVLFAMAAGLLLPPNMLGVYSIDTRMFTMGLLAVFLFCELPRAALRLSAFICLVLSLHANLWMLEHLRFRPGTPVVKHEVLNAGGFRQNVREQFYFSVSPFAHVDAYDAVDQGRLQPLYFDTATLTNRAGPAAAPPPSDP